MRAMRCRLIAIALLAGAFTRASAQVQVPVSAPAATVIRAGVLVDPESGNASTNQTIVVVNGIITAVGPNATAPPGASMIDLSRSVVLPGLFDAHTHLCMDVNLERDAANYFYTTLRDSDSYRAVEGVVNARAMLDAGFTTVRDVGNEGNFACVSVRMAIQQGKFAGPTMITAGRILAPYGGQFHLQPDRPELAEPEYAVADTRDEMLKAVRENIHFGAGVIKIVVDDQPYIYSTDDIRFIVEEAAKAGLKVAAHVWTRQGAHNAAAAGVASLEHLEAIADEDLEVAKRSGVTAVFTPFPMASLQQFSTPERAKMDYDQQMDRLRAARRIGVPIAFGTDVIAELPGMNRGTTAIQWIDSYTTAGFSPRDILRVMTTNAAKLLGVDKERGAIRPQMAADIIATDGNPLQDIDALKRITFVMKNGRVVKERAN